MIDSFIIKQHLTNIFEGDVIPNIIKYFNEGIIVGSDKGNLLFIEKIINNDTITFKPIRSSKRDKPVCVTGISINKTQSHCVVSYASNEIAYFSLTNIFESLKAINFELRMTLVCDGFHQGPITAMDISLQRPLIITASSSDKSIRITQPPEERNKIDQKWKNFERIAKKRNPNFVDPVLPFSDNYVICNYNSVYKNIYNKEKYLA